MLDLQAYTPMPASEDAMTAFHEPDYISFLRHVTPDNQVRHSCKPADLDF